MLFYFNIHLSILELEEEMDPGQWREAVRATVAAREAADLVATATPTPTIPEPQRVILGGITADVSAFVDALFDDHGDTLREAMERAGRHEPSRTAGGFVTETGGAMVDEGAEYVTWSFYTPLTFSPTVVQPPVRFCVRSDKRWWFEARTNLYDFERECAIAGIDDHHEPYLPIVDLSPEWAIVARGCMAGWLVLCGIL